MEETRYKKPPFELKRTMRGGLAEQLAAEFRRAIQTGYYRPGDMLPPVREQTALLKVSRVVVVRAMAMLAEERLVHPRPHYGCEVCSREKPLWKGQVLIIVPPGIGNPCDNTVYAVLRDALTVNGYLGTDGIAPLLEQCKTFDKGIFVLVKTSNKSSGELQDLMIGNKSVYATMGAMCERWGRDNIGKYGYSAVGAVVGATYPEQLEEMRKALPHTFFLVPGYGAQGGGAQGVAKAFDENGLGAIVNSSRGVMCAYKKEEGCDEKDFAKAARREVIRMKEDITSHIPPIKAVEK